MASNKKNIEIIYTLHECTDQELQRFLAELSSVTGMKPTRVVELEDTCIDKDHSSED
ncbi:hypothetical protein [Roseivirga seohaensis]|uniref:hypothetical protein n=1 Tax=Roseivirga seohaensis TaxID=1914963 RepID=UPI003BAA3DAE